MKKVYIQIIDPIHGTCVNAYHEYSGGYNQVITTVLRQYGVSEVEHRIEVVDNDDLLPGMPEYMRMYAVVSGTSKLLNITIVG